MSKHTPGPWTVAHEGGAEGGYFIDAKDDVVVLARGRIEEADARLIAAAPDLLAALQDMPDIIKDFDGGNPETSTGWASEEMLDLWTRVNAALAKAGVS